MNYVKAINEDGVCVIEIPAISEADIERAKLEISVCHPGCTAVVEEYKVYTKEMIEEEIKNRK